LQVVEIESMTSRPLTLAVVPARGGSKRIPRKNVREFCGKPMIAWSIEVARNSHLFDKIIVSTDDAEITRIAQQHGAEVPFLRPAELADDHVGTTEVVAHAVQWALGKGWSLTAVCCIYATAPFITVSDLRRGWEQLTQGEWSYAFAVTEYPASIFRAFRAHPSGGLEMVFPEHFTTRSQDLPVTYHDAAQFYWGRPQAWLDHRRMFDRFSATVAVPRWRVQDIDTEEDWRRAELMADSLRANVPDWPHV
jgi:pseudaminic acid cytidylyltransferase